MVKKNNLLLLKKKLFEVNIKEDFEEFRVKRSNVLDS